MYILIAQSMMFDTALAKVSKYWKSKSFYTQMDNNYNRTITTLETLDTEV